MILQMPHSFRWGDRAGVGISKIPAESVYGRCQRLACYVPKSGGERQIRHFSSAFILMYTVSFIIYITVRLTLLCALFVFYWIYIKICGESVPLRPDRTEKILKEPGGPYQIGKVLRALFSPPESVFKRVTQSNDTARKGSELMIRPILRDCAKYVRGPPKWIRTDSLWGGKIEKVNQIWFTPTFRPNAPCVGQVPHAAHGYETANEPAVWRVCGAVGRREPYNLTLENKTYYTQNYDNMR